MPANIPTKKTLRQNQGFTLIEIVITIVILGAVAGILVPFFNAIVHSPDPVIRERAISLGQAMMDEIMAKKWDKNTPMGGGPICTTGESGTGRGTGTYTLTCPDVSPENKNASTIATIAGTITDRSLLHAVDDYNGWMEPKNGNFYDQNGKPFSMPNYTRAVTVRYILSKTDPITWETDYTGGKTTDTKLVVVTVTSPRGEVFNFVAVACNI